MEDKNLFKLIAAIVGLLVVVFVLLTSIPVVVVGAGERGVIFNTVSGVENKVLGEGIHFRIPWLQNVTKLSVKVQKNDVKAEAASKDLQTVSTDIVANWHLDAANVNWVFQNVGNEQAVVEKVLGPAISEVVKAATAKYTAEDVIAKRPLLKQDIDDALTARMQSYHVILDDVSIVNVDFSPEFNKAIEQKTVAVQNAQKAENDLKRIQIEAEQRVAQARAEAEAIKIQTEALEKNQNLIQLELAKRWNGVLPQIVLGNQMPLLNLPMGK